MKRIPHAVPARDTWRDHLRDAGEIVAGIVMLLLWFVILAAVLPVVLS